MMKYALSFVTNSVPALERSPVKYLLFTIDVTIAASIPDGSASISFRILFSI